MVFELEYLHTYVLRYLTKLLPNLVALTHNYIKHTEHIVSVGITSLM